MDWAYLTGSAEAVAPRLLGCILERKVNGRLITVRIVETEAYDQTDAASHSYRGKTARTEVMFGPPGHLYVYFTYGMHYCCNIVVGKAGHGAAVLVRAVEPLSGEKEIISRRGGKSGHELTNGPAKLCQALSIDQNLNGHDLSVAPLKLVIKPPIKAEKIRQSERIGISRAKDKLWRFYITDNPYVSR